MITEKVANSKVAILMSTYNGEKYVEEQIQSILNQERVDVKLIVRDDGSSDSTVEIVKNFCSKYDNVTLFAESNVGCKWSFFKLAEYASQSLKDYEYFAFSDQDDFWLQDKIRTAIDMLNEAHQSSSLLYISETVLVDKNLNKIPIVTKSKCTFRHTIEEALMIQPAPGCVMVFNKTLLNLFVKTNMSDMLLHDESLYKVCLICGGKVIFDSRAFIFYRQHENNTIGGNQSLGTRLGRWTKKFIQNNCEWSNEVKSLLHTFESEIPFETKRQMTYVATYKTNLLNRFRLIFSRKFTTGQIKINIIFRIAVLCGRF